MNQGPKTTRFPYPKFREHKGVLHLFRSASQSSLPNPNSSSPLVFIVAIPNYLSFDDFIRFCGPHLDHLLFIRSDGMEDRYSVLIKFVDQFDADGFYSNFNGKKFSPGEAGICHIIFLLSVEYSEYVEVAGTTPAGVVQKYQLAQFALRD